MNPRHWKQKGQGLEKNPLAVRHFRQSFDRCVFNPSTPSTPHTHHPVPIHLLPPWKTLLSCPAGLHNTWLACCSCTVISIEIYSKLVIGSNKRDVRNITILQQILLCKDAGFVESCFEEPRLEMGCIIKKILRTKYFSDSAYCILHKWNWVCAARNMLFVVELRQ